MAEEIREKAKAFCGINPLWLAPPHVAIAVLVISLGLDYLLPTPPTWNFRNPLFGFTLIGLGAVVIVWTLGLFCKWATSPSPAKKASTLVTEGPFRITRNPIYLGGTALLAGCAVVWGSIAGLFAPVAFFLVMNFVYIPFEEQRLLDAFGNAYVAYKSRIRRWL